VRISIRRCDAQQEDGAEQPAKRVALLELVDDGIGMTPEVAQRIFDPFFTTKFPGRGLGLAVVFGGVRRHGGQVTADAPASGGARFVIQLPLAGENVLIPMPPKKTAVAVGDAPLATTLAVIIVDDEAIVRTALTSMLRKLGVQAHAFEHGQDAIHYVEALPDPEACIALVDWTMPGMDGGEVIRRLRDTGKQVYCVLMSGHARAHVDDCARQVAPDRLLAKPFSLDEVRNTLQELRDEMRLLR
jgi:two-component system, cell cycle sensor histidine kinase and response regulator CckA